MRRQEFYRRDRKESGDSEFYFKIKSRPHYLPARNFPPNHPSPYHFNNYQSFGAQNEQLQPPSHFSCNSDFIWMPPPTLPQPTPSWYVTPPLPVLPTQVPVTVPNAYSPVPLNYPPSVHGPPWYPTISDIQNVMYRSLNNNNSPQPTNLTSGRKTTSVIKKHVPNEKERNKTNIKDITSKDKKERLKPKAKKLRKKKKNQKEETNTMFKVKILTKDNKVMINKEDKHNCTKENSLNDSGISKSYEGNIDIKNQCERDENITHNRNKKCNIKGANRYQISQYVNECFHGKHKQETSESETKMSRNDECKSIKCSNESNNTKSKLSYNCRSGSCKHYNTIKMFCDEDDKCKAKNKICGDGNSNNCEYISERHSEINICESEINDGYVNKISCKMITEVREVVYEYVHLNRKEEGRDNTEEPIQKNIAEVSKSAANYCKSVNGMTSTSRSPTAPDNLKMLSEGVRQPPGFPFEKSVNNIPVIERNYNSSSLQFTPTQLNKVKRTFLSCTEEKSSKERDSGSLRFTGSNHSESTWSDNKSSDLHERNSKTSVSYNTSSSTVYSECSTSVTSKSSGSTNSKKSTTSPDSTPIKSVDSSVYDTPDNTPVAFSTPEVVIRPRVKRSLTEHFNDELSSSADLNSSTYYTPESSPRDYGSSVKRLKITFNDPRPSIFSGTSNFLNDSRSSSTLSKNGLELATSDIQPELIGYQLVGDSQFCRFGQQLLGLERVSMPNCPGRIGICVSGQTITDLHKRVKEKFYPISERVILMIGTNDFLRNVEIGTMCQELKALITTLLETVTQMVLLTLPPIPKLERRHRMMHFMMLSKYNNFIRSLEDGERLRIADVSPLYISSPPFQRCRMDLFELYFGGPARRHDMIHLNRQGLEVIRKYILEHFL